MNLSPENYAEICKQSAFISALVAGFSFAFLGALLVSSFKNQIIDWVMSFSILSIAGLLVCSLAWTLSASRMALYNGNNITQVPQTFLNLHRILSIIFILSFFFFLVTLGLSGWIRSRKLGIISSLISFISAIFFIVIMSQFVT
jgi:bacteriorhodopsin